MNDGSSNGRIGFEVDGTTLTVRDVIEGKRMRIRVDREPDLSSALTALFPLPVDRAVSFEAESVSVAEYSSIILRDDEGEFVGRPNEATELPRGSYYIEITGTTKAYVRVNDVEIAMSGMRGSDPIEFAFDRPRTVTVGARSFHTRPEATITVPDDPSALAEAVSVLGSSIREFSPERSWPTLRGYPPRIERGDALDIPSPLVAPDTGIEVIVRPTYADVYRLSTLTYYLGARMRIGDAPAIRLDNGYEERLPTEGRALEVRVTELLRTWFFLDTLVRTDGYTISDREEYEEVGPQIPFYPPNLADLSLSERLMEYLEVDSDTVAPYTPNWATEPVLHPVAEAAELLPHLAHLLAPIRIRGSADPSRPDGVLALTTTDRVSGSLLSRSSDRGPVPDPDTDPIPAGTAAALPEAYDHGIQRTPPNNGEATVAFLVRSGERARRLREALTDQSSLDGVGSLSILETPTSDTVADILTDPSIDLLYSDLPVDDGVPAVDDGPVKGLRHGSSTEQSSPGGPSVTIFEGSRHAEAGVEAVLRGGVGSAVIDGRVSVDRIRTTVKLLTSKGLPLDTCLAVTRVSDSHPTRFAGNASASVVSPNPLSPNLLFADSVTASEHRLIWRAILSPRSWLGSEYEVISDHFDDKTRLLGRDPTERPIVSSGSVVESLAEPDTVLFLNGRFISPSADLTVEDVEASARRALAADGASESSERTAIDDECRCPE